MADDMPAAGNTGQFTSDYDAQLREAIRLAGQRGHLGLDGATPGRGYNIGRQHFEIPGKIAFWIEVRVSIESGVAEWVADPDGAGQTLLLAYNPDDIFLRIKARLEEILNAKSS